MVLGWQPEEWGSYQEEEAVRDLALVAWEQVLWGDRFVTGRELADFAWALGRATRDATMLFEYWIPPAPLESYEVAERMVEALQAHPLPEFWTWPRARCLRDRLEEEALGEATPRERTEMLARLSDALFRMGC